MKYSAIAPILAFGIAATAAMTAPQAHADPAYGLGISYIFGPAGGTDVALGVKVFSDDTPEQGVVSLGIDYKLGSQAVRPNIGAAWLDNDVYGDVNVGYDFGENGIDFGVGLGGWTN